MFASVGDHIVVKSHRVGQVDRGCEVIAVDHADGAPPYRVRWEHSDHETLFFPGPDAWIEHGKRTRAARSKER